MRRTFPTEAGANREAAQRFRGRETEKLGGALECAKALRDVVAGLVEMTQFPLGFRRNFTKEELIKQID